MSRRYSYIDWPNECRDVETDREEARLWSQMNLMVTSEDFVIAQAVGFERPPEEFLSRRNFASTCRVDPVLSWASYVDQSAAKWAFLDSESYNSLTKRALNCPIGYSEYR
jgi:hypothetical protein